MDTLNRVHLVINWALSSKVDRGGDFMGTTNLKFYKLAQIPATKVVGYVFSISLCFAYG